jgi:hypothetical protein
VIELSDAATSVLGRSFRYYLAVDSWYGGDLLAADIPVTTGSEEVDRSLKVPERLTLTVPRVDRGTSWSPVAYDHPLAANGQRLRVQLGIGLGGADVEWFQRGWYLIGESSVDADTVTVTATGLLTLIDEARLVSPYQPTLTMISTIRGLVEPALTVVVDDSVADRSVPAGINFDQDRLQAVLDLLDAWPATASVDPDGYLFVTSTTIDTTPVLALTNGAGGTVITATGSSTREGGYNVVVSQGSAADGGAVQGVAYVSSGPHSYTGEFSPLPVPYFFDSPLLTTNAQCTASSQTILARLQRSNTVSFDIEMVPHPGMQTGDVVSITTDDHTDLACTVEHLALPLTADGGAQKCTVRSLA